MSGGIIISEIMYDLKNGSDDGREWIEVYNNSDTPVDLSTFKFFEADTNHKLISVAGEANVSPLGYALLVSDFAKFKNDNPNFVGNIFDSTFSLSNTGENLILKDKDLTVAKTASARNYGSLGVRVIHILSFTMSDSRVSCYPGIAGSFIVLILSSAQYFYQVGVLLLLSSKNCSVGLIP